MRTEQFASAAMIERVYAFPQVYGIGSFLRQCGGFLTMGEFAEPLGTDQASPPLGGTLEGMWSLAV